MRDRIFQWMDQHPTFVKLYVPITVTVTLIMALVEPFIGGCRCN